VGWGSQGICDRLHCPSAAGRGGHPGWVSETAVGTGDRAPTPR